MSHSAAPRKLPTWRWAALAARVQHAIDQLENSFFPRGAKKLEPHHEERYRLRVGTYRIVYRVFKSERRILVTVIDKRGQSTLYE